MKKRLRYTFLVFSILALASRAQLPAVNTPSTAAKLLAQLPLYFESSAAGFSARGPGYQLSLHANEAVLSLPYGATKAPQVAQVKLRAVNANPAAQLSGLAELAGKSHYLTGNDPARWRTNVAHYARVKAAAVYPGIDLVWHGQARQLEYDFNVAPGADTRQIKLQFTGAERLELDAAGALILHTAAGPVRQHKPEIYQEAQGVRQPVSGGYVLDEAGQVGFEIGAYDAARALVIDPVLAYSTYLGGTRDVRLSGLNIGDFASDIAVDAAGNAYVAGYSYSTDFPTEKPLQAGLKAAPDAVVFKLNPTGNALVYATYLGGNSFDAAGGIAVDGAGNAYVTGATESTDFPTVRPLQGTIKKGAGFGDAFIAKLNADGSALVYSTFFGGSGAESGSGIAVDAAGNAYVTGATFGSTDLPLEKPFQASYGGGNCIIDGEPIPCPDAYVAKLNPAGSALLYSTYLGGNQFECSTGIAVDAQGRATLAGATSSANFPTRNAAQANFAGGACVDFACADAFVTRLTADGSALVFSTYLGGGRPADNFEVDGPIDVATGVAVDGAGNSYVSGCATSRDFPLRNATRNANSYGEAFVTKLDPAGALVYSTLLGGSEPENLYNLLLSFFSIIGDGYNHTLAADAAGNVYVTGYTASNDFPVQEPAQANLRGSADAFVTKLDPAGQRVWSTYLGGDGPEIGFAVAADAAGNAYVAGVTNSANFPVVNARQTTLKGSGDIFVAKLSAAMPSAVASVSAASYSGAALAPESIVAAFGTKLAVTTQASAQPLPTTLAGTTVRVRDSAGTERLAPLFFVAPTQVNYQFPTGTAAGAATITIISGDGNTAIGTVRSAPVAPGLFGANSNGQGVAAAIVVRVRADGTQSFEPAVRFDAAQNAFVAVPIDLGAESDQVFLALFGTGWRFRSSLGAVNVRLGGTDAPVEFAGAQGQLTGLDQLNARLPRTLIGRGEVEVALMMDGQAANAVRVNIK